MVQNNVFYRKWRPQSLYDLVGQDHVVSTLKASLEQGRIAHAYLFVGPRGTGKTSTARILAKERVIFRLTKFSPRLGDSWLNIIPLQANTLNASR